MRNLFFITVAFLIAQELNAQPSDYLVSQGMENSISTITADTLNQWEKVRITSNESILEQLIPGEMFVVKHKIYDKSIKNVTQAENDAIIKLKKLAEEKGYKTVKIEKMYNKVTGVPKRRYRIVKIRALGYKEKI